jgi:Glycosyltransferase like family 2
VDVVVPFRGSAGERARLLARLRVLALREGDTLTVVDNGPDPPVEPGVLHAAAIATSYHARNRGAAVGRAPWILFVDADVEAAPDLLDRYFDPAPGELAGVVGGGVRDEVGGGSLAARHAALAQPMAHHRTLAEGRWRYAQTANALVRRAAFEAAGGFRETLRSGGDADLCFRLRDAGWAIEARPDAAVVHRARTTLRAVARQRFRHGAGAAWLNRTYPGSFPARLGPGSAWYVMRLLASAGAAAIRGRRDAAAVALTEALGFVAFNAGRLAPWSQEQRPRDEAAAQQGREASGVSRDVGGVLAQSAAVPDVGAQEAPRVGDSERERPVAP